MSDPTPGPPAAPIRPRPLSREAFAPFGQVLMALGEEAQRQEFAARLRNHRPQATLNLAFLLSRPAESPWVVRELERHPCSSQCFVPVQGTRYLVVVCPSRDDGDPDRGRLAAFIAEGGQAVSYDPGVWHAPHAVLEGPGSFIMLRWDCGTPDDTERRPLTPPIRLSPPTP